MPGATHRLAPDRRAAQEADGWFMTDYARQSPDAAALAETALFAHPLLRRPDLFPPADTQAVRNAGPRRIACIERLLPPGQPIFETITGPRDCDG